MIEAQTGTPDAHAPPMTEVREAHDASDHKVLKRDPSNEAAQADIASDESFPASDPPSHTQGGGRDPAPSSGYDEEAERKMAEEAGRDSL